MNKKKPFKVIAGTSDKPLKISDVEIPCYVLENEMRVFSQTGLMNAILAKNFGLDGTLKIPNFFTSNAIKPFIHKELLAPLSTPIRFKAPHGGPPTYGYPATILADICDAFLEARNKMGQKLPKPVQRTADRCEVLVRGFARVGIVALVDEATGYIQDKKKQEYQELFKQFIRDSARQYEKEFPDELYDAFYSIYNIPQRGKKQHRPLFFAKVTRKYVYEPLALSNGAILEMLEEKNPVIISKSGESKYRKYTLHQFLEEEVGVNALRAHLWQLVGILKASSNKKAFDSNFNKVFKPDYQMELMEEEV